MEYIDRYRGELLEVFAEAEAEAGRFPDELGRLGRELVGACHPQKTGGKASGIAYLLPYWMDDITGLGSRVCRDLAVGSLFAMLHYSIVDDLMDGTEAAPADPRRLLALGQLFHAAFQARYARHAAADPERLWALYARYAAEWAAAVGGEPERRADPLDVRQLARKSAPVKLGAAAMLAAAGMDERLPAVEEALDLALAVLQLCDDWHDWAEDLANPGGNAFLTLVQDALGTADAAGEAGAGARPLTERDVKAAVFRRGALNRLARIADGYAARIDGTAAPPMLALFARTLADSIRRGAEEAEAAASRLIAGNGFTRMLTEISKN
jgi:hypothetical protein